MALDASVLALLLQSCAPNVAPSTMLAVIRVESKGQPFAIGVNSGSALRAQPANSADAIATARSLAARSVNFDAGLMQINSANFTALGVSPDTVFDPCTNLRAGARILADNYQRARQSGHAAPLQAALSEYNTGSRSRGLTNGYVGKIYAAGGQDYGPVAQAPRFAGVSPAHVAHVLLNAFGGRITDTVRPMNARYGAEYSYHKYAQAVDFVPRGGVLAVDRVAVRRVMQANGILLLELLGPGDPGHADHWHVAFSSDVQRSAPPVMRSQAPSSIVVDTANPGNRTGSRETDGPITLAASLDDGAPEPRRGAVKPAPPPWDVFGRAAYQRESRVW